VKAVSSEQILQAVQQVLGTDQPVRQLVVQGQPVPGISLDKTADHHLHLAVIGHDLVIVGDYFHGPHGVQGWRSELSRYSLLPPDSLDRMTFLRWLGLSLGNALPLTPHLYNISLELRAGFTLDFTITSTAVVVSITGPPAPGYGGYDDPPQPLYLLVRRRVRDDG